MDMLENMRAFLAVAEAKSFTAASDSLGLAVSVVTKRVSQLEDAVGVELLTRTTRKVSLSPEGEYHRSRISEVVSRYDDAISAIRKGSAQLEGLIRIKVPTVLGIVHLNSIIKKFIEANPLVDVEILLRDGPFDPKSENIDIAITAFPETYDEVIDHYLWPLTSKLVASPTYFENHDLPEHPRDLAKHRCIVYQPTRESWAFIGPSGPITVLVHARLMSNDMNILFSAAMDGMGIGLLTTYVVQEALEEGKLVEVLAGYPTPDRWVKAVIPKERATLPRIAALLNYLKDNPVFSRKFG